MSSEHIATLDLRGAIRKIAPFFAPHRRRLAIVLALALATSALAALEPLALKLLFDELAGPRLALRLAAFVAGLVVLLGARELLSAVMDVLVWRVRIAVNFALLSATVDRLHELPIAWHRGHAVGALTTKIDRGVGGAVSAFSDFAFQLLPAVVYLLVSLVVMFGLDARLAVVVAAFAPLPAWIGARAAKEQTARERDLLDRWTTLFARFHEVLGGMLVVKSFVMEEQEKRRFLSGVSDANDVVVRGVRTDAATTAKKGAVTALARVSAIALGGVFIARGEISLGTLVAFLGYAGGLFGPVQSLTSIYQTLRRGTVAVEALFSILDAKTGIDDAPDAIEAGALGGHVEFRDVHFAYGDGAEVLRGIDLRVRPGETIALVGPSGAGKTTIMTLLQRLYEPTAGSILLDDVDLRRFSQRSLRRRIGVVLQEGMLFSDTVAANIAFGRPGATREEIEAAAKAANAHDFITKLPNGYDTNVGERGARLSGGERQRVAIARALLKDPPILVLDEATSALDAESEALVQEALSRLLTGRTTFVIAHRLSTITEADRILVLRDGRIAESGTHAELVARGGDYAGLVQRQVRGLLATPFPPLVAPRPPAAA